MKTTVKSAKNQQAIILDALPSNAFVIDEQLKVIYWNTAIAKATHISSGEIVNRNIMRFFPNFKELFSPQQLQRVFNGGEALNLVSNHGEASYACTLAGNPPVHESTVSPVYWEETGTIAALFLISANAILLTARNSMQETKKEAVIVNETPNATTCDFQKINQKLGLHIIKRTAALAASEERYRSLFENVPAALLELNYNALKSDIERRFAGRPPADFTDYQKTNPLLVEHWLRLLHIENSNRVALQLYGAAAPTALTPENSLFATDTAREILLQQIAAFLSGQNTFLAEFDTRRLNGQPVFVSFQAAAAPGSETNWEKILISVVDISGRKIAEQKLQQAHEALERRVSERTAELAAANRALQEGISERKATEDILRNTLQELRRSNQELEQFASIASHDLKEPLRKVRAFGDRLRRFCEDNLNDRAMDYLERMESATMRMEHFIDSLLMLSRVTTKAQPFQQVSLNKVCQEILTDLEIRIEQTGGVVHIDNLPEIEADDLQMHQLFQNLIGNALKFYIEGRPPVVRIFTIEPPPEFRGFCGIVVQDNGIGIDSEFRERIFKPFQRLHSRHTYEGTGMGLAICQKIIERHNGHIFVTDAPETGSEFHVYLPFKQLSAKSQNNEPAAT